MYCEKCGRESGEYSLCDECYLKARVSDAPTQKESNDKDQNKLKCKKCGSSNFKFINLPYQIKREPVILKIIYFFAFFIFITSLFLLLGAVASHDIEFIIICAYITGVSASAAFVIYIFLQLLPPDTYSDLHCVCTYCGHSERIKDDSEESNG